MFRVLVVGMMLLLSSPVAGQRISGELRLEVTDPQGAAVRAVCKIVGEATGVERTFQTDETGRSTVRALPPGRYELVVSSDGFASRSDAIEIQSQLPLEHRVTLQLSRLSSTVEVTEVDTLLDPLRTAQYLPRQVLEDRPTAAPGRSVVGLVNTQPGWLLEANGVLHPRGSEYDVQYVVDGIPLYDNRSPAFAQSVDLGEYQSVNVRTAGYPAEFGLKLGGVIEIASGEDASRGLHGTAAFQSGSFANRGGSLSLGYNQGRTTAGISGEAMATHRYLDPPVEQNYTNRGSGGAVSGTFERLWSNADRTRFYAYTRNTQFMVPNELLQQMAGQRQDRSVGETLGQVSHTHIFSSRILGQFRAMLRDTDVDLWSNPFSTPIAPSQSRSFREGYFAGSLSAHYGHHELKAGGEGLFTSIHEDMSFHIVAYRLGTVRIFDGDVPRDFRFSESARGRTGSGFVQDSWRIGSLNLNAGVRFDHYRLVESGDAWSPRLGAAYEVPRVGLVVRASYDRVFQIPAMENILLASSDRVGNLGGEGGFLSLLPSRGNFVETGFSKSLSNHVRIDGNWYRRRLENFSDDSLLLNTGVSFPIAVSEATIRGTEAKIEVRSIGRFSGEVSYTNMIGIGKLPVAGGLFLGNNADELLNGTGSFPISQDQRNTFRSRLRVQVHPRVWFAFAASYNSGLPFEIDGVSNEQFIEQQYGSRILDKVNFERGRVRPSSSLDVSTGVDVVRTDKLKLRLQADAFNLANRLNLINFAGVFSGTALEASRNYAVRLRTEF
ncbi:MAG TPA: TonB-dependent receptor [Terriglobia bacterium]|nr:TonB-dependent receptor [Terriglobia bacterium]